MFKCKHSKYIWRTLLSCQPDETRSASGWNVYIMKWNKHVVMWLKLIVQHSCNPRLYAQNERNAIKLFNNAMQSNRVWSMIRSGMLVIELIIQSFRLSINSYVRLLLFALVYLHSSFMESSNKEICIILLFNRISNLTLPNRMHNKFGVSAVFFFVFVLPQQKCFRINAKKSQLHHKITKQQKAIRMAYTRWYISCAESESVRLQLQRS